MVNVLLHYILKLTYFLFNFKKMVIQIFSIDFTIFSERFQTPLLETDWIFDKYKNVIYEVTKYENEVSIKNFDNQLISVIVDDYIEELESDDHGTHLHGGFKIKSKNTKIGTTCCSSFSDYINWEEILTEPKSDWTSIWIGHPWVYYKIVDEFILFSNYTENENDINEMMRIDFEVFKIELKMWFDEIQKFKKKVKNYIESKYPQKSEFYYNAMIEGEIE